MSLETPSIPAETARHVIWTFGREGGYRPGTYTQKLLELLAYADEGNTAKLATVYPAEVAAVRLAKYDEDGMDQLQRIAGNLL
ncbi:hypothetical protein ACIBEA_30095 [Streptomyces sp. NPDC051555]|uniref:hypothetical protein n=1 Tax=Streptomyces sp. NPDC051555 TaxID=3365657 RepID=UPI0037889A7A